MTFIATTAIIAGASTLYGVGKGIAQNAKANSIDKANQRPTYIIPKEYTDNVNMAKQMAQVGLPQQQYNNQLNSINRNQAGGLQTLGRSANPGSGVASLIRASNDANNTLNAQDAAARQQNQRFFIGQNGILGQQKLAQQQYDKFDKYTENFNRAQGLRGAANQNFQNAANSASGIAYGLGANHQGGGDGLGGVGVSSSPQLGATTYGTASPYVTQPPIYQPRSADPTGRFNSFYGGYQ